MHFRLFISVIWIKMLFNKPNLIITVSCRVLIYVIPEQNSSWYLLLQMYYSKRVQVEMTFWLDWNNFFIWKFEYKAIFMNSSITINCSDWNWFLLQKSNYYFSRYVCIFQKTKFMLRRKFIEHCFSYSVSNWNIW